MGELKALPFEDLGFARIDHHRRLRNGYPEVIYGEGKPGQAAAIFQRLADQNNVLCTRATAERPRHPGRYAGGGLSPGLPDRGASGSTGDGDRAGGGGHRRHLGHPGG